MAQAPPFVHLHVHTDYSILDGMCKLDRLLAATKSAGSPAVAITDHGNMCGAVSFYKLARAAGIKPIIGCEFYLAPGSMQSRGVNDVQENNRHLVLIARNNQGYLNLMQLVSAAQVEGFYYKPRVDKELLARYTEGLICLTACIKGEIPQHLLKVQEREAEAALDFYRQLYGKENVYLELQDHGMRQEREVMPRLIDLAQRTGAPMVVTNDAHYINAADAYPHDLLLCIQTVSDYADPGRLRFDSVQYWLKTPEEMFANFHHFPEAMQNTVAIAEQCELELELGASKLPKFPVPGGQSEDDYLAELVRQGAIKRYGEITEPIEQRIAYELGVIEKTGFAGYFLIVWDIVKYAREKEIAVGPGRGSAAGSIVSYCLGITDIDPLRFGLLFERFLTADRISPPDIDTDFHDGRRDEVIAYIKQRWGMDAVSQIITFGSLAAKGAIRDVSRVLKVPVWKADKLSKAIGWALDATIDKALERSTEFKALYQEEEDNRKVVDSARQLEGIIRQASTHAAGVVITPGGIRSFVPLHHGSNNDVVTGYDMDSIAEVGLIKMDVLGLRTLTIIEDALGMIKKNHGHDVRTESLALDDPQTYSLIASGQTSGIFQLESSGMRDLCRRSTPSCIEDLSAILALYRPGPLGSGMVDDYVARKRGEKKVEYLHPALKPILEETYGVFVYQEQIMQMAQVLAGFSLGEGDTLRKAMAKKDNKTLEKVKPRFLEGAREHGVDPKIANQIIEILGPFADYCFNKPHTASYAILAYQTAFLKAHYPQEFMAACLSSEINDTDKLADYITECRNLSIEVHPPDINESEALFTVVDGRIRFGMAAIKNVGLPAIGMVTATRRDGGRFRSLTDFCCRIDMGIANRKVMESLIRAGAFDSLGYTRPEYLHILPGCMEIGARMANERDTGKMFMFGGGEESASADIADAKPLGASEWSRAQILDEEKQIFGFYLSGHPHEEQYQQVERVVTDHAADLEGGKKRRVKVGGMITTMRQITDKNGKEMAFVGMQDTTGSFEVTVFASLFARVEFKLMPEAFVVVTGKLEANGDRGAKIIADDVLGLDEATPPHLSRVHVRVYLDNHSEQQMESLRALAQPDPDSPDLYLHIIGEDKTEQVIKAGPNFRIPGGDQILERVRGLFGGANVWVE